MNFFKRAWFSIIRRKGKSIILFATIFILGNLIAGAVAIRQSTLNVEEKVKADLGSIATIDWDYDELQTLENQDSIDIKNLDEDTINKVGKLSYVKSFDYSLSGYINVEKFLPISTSNEDDNSEELANGINLKGTNTKTPIDFSSHQVQLTDGESFTQEEVDEGKNVAIISSEVAKENGLTVGDVLLLDSLLHKYKDDGSHESHKGSDYPLTIKGIFKPESIEKKNNDNSSDNEETLENFDSFFETEQLNTFYLPNKAVREIMENETTLDKKISPEAYLNEDGTEQNFEDFVHLSPTYILDSPESGEYFREEAEPHLPELYKVKISTDKYDEVGSSMKSLAQISEYVLIGATIATLIITTLIVVLFLRDRKHEIGIYLSIGEKRMNIITQIVLELLFIGILALCLSVVTGKFIGDIVSKTILNSDLLNVASSENIQYYDAFSANISLTSEDIQNAYSVDFSLSYVVIFFITSLLTILGSAVLPLIYILRLNPKKIMMQEG